MARKEFEAIKNLQMPVKMLLHSSRITTGLFHPLRRGLDRSWELDTVGDLIDDLRIKWFLFAPRTARRDPDKMPRNFREVYTKIKREQLSFEAVNMQWFWESFRETFPNLIRLDLVIRAK